MEEVVHAAAHWPERLIKPVLERRELGLIAQMPFAEDGRVVAGRLDELDNGALPDRQSEIM